MSELIDMTDMVFGYLTVLGPSEKRAKSGQAYWWCRCICDKGGQIDVEVLGKNLRSGRSRSCGACTALGKDRKVVSRDAPMTHGESATNTYRTWKSMKERCTNPNHVAYEEYGGRGIKVCDEWLRSYKNFVDDMGTRPWDMTLDRIDVNGDYTKENCEWATVSDQNKNRRPTHSVKMVRVMLPMMRHSKIKKFNEQLKANYVKKVD